MSSHRLIVVSLFAGLVLSGCAAKRTPAAPVPAGPDFSEAGHAENAIPPDDQLFFGFDSDELDSDGRTMLAQVATWVKADPTRVVVVQGHADSAGARAYNLDLSSRRAGAAADELHRLGIPVEQIVVVGVGEGQASLRPAQVNRRVVVFATAPSVSSY